ncbi:MAG: hypothetical protein U0821_18625 [Chloroflexota bacterium]
MAQSHTLQLIAKTALAAGTANDKYTADTDMGRFERAVMLLDVTAAPGAGTDTLNVYVQKNVGARGTEVWTDFVSFTQTVGGGGTKQHVAEVCATASPTSSMHLVQDGQLAAGTVNHGPWSDQWRVKTVTAGGGSAFTFTLTAHLFNSSD